MLNTCVKYVNNKSIHGWKYCYDLFTSVYRNVFIVKKRWISNDVISTYLPIFTPIYTQFKLLFYRYKPSLIHAIHSTYYYNNEKKIKKGI